VYVLGYGPFISTEFAMLMDVLPSEDDAGKDMALWHSALLLPQIVATPVAGWLLDWFQEIGKRDQVQCLGYKVVFIICIVYFLSGAEATRRIHGVK
jgi:MFS family permease